jgi:hypothetical protein
MTKKVLFVLALAFQFFAATGNIPAADPMPGCSPCPWVR